MATLSKHGAEILRLEYCTHRVAYMEDGKILQNFGSGWKLRAKCKPGVDPVEHAKQVARNREERDGACPMLAAYRDKIIEITGELHERSTLHQVIELMPSDADGVWSTMEDQGQNYDLEDLVELCRLYEMAIPEMKTWKARKAQPVAA